MKQAIYIFLTLFFTNICFSQTTFKKGYFINNSNNKVECFIKDADWLETPESFTYKLSENDETSIGKIDFVKEFSVYDVFKYIRSDVEIDLSSESIYELDNDSKIDLVKKQLFLKVLIEGDVSLYEYINGDIKKFFFNNGNSEIKQLIYKKYIGSGDQLKHNNHYKQQLLNSFNCEPEKIDFKKLSYTKSNLVKLFISQNNCIGEGKIQDFESSREKERLNFNFSIKPRLNNSNIKTESSLNSIEESFKGNVSVGIGIEAEAILPFNNNKWALIAAINYLSFKDKNDTSEIEFKSINFPFGVRHYFFIGNDSKLFVNSSLIINMKTELTVNQLLTSEGPKLNSSFGIGYKKNKYSVELNYESNNIVLSSTKWGYNFNNLSLAVGYDIF